MDLLGFLSIGFATALSWSNILVCFAGVFLGTVIGVLPGLGPTATVSLLLPLTFTMNPASAVILMAGIYYGSQYGGSLTSILVRIPGESASVVTCIDGYEMAKRGRAGAALGIAAFGSFIAGIVVTIALFFVGPVLARFALRFGPPEYAALVLLGLLLVTQVSQTSCLNSLIMACLGLLLSTVGVDRIHGDQRFTFGLIGLFNGFNVAVLCMGLFAIAELLTSAEGRENTPKPVAQPRRLREMLPNREEWRRSTLPITRGTALGFLLGILPGGGATIASFAAYVMERRISKHPERFGQGAIEGVAGPESANNAAAQASFIPLLSLGIPANAVLAVVLASLLVQGVLPGPTLMTKSPDLFFGVIISMLVGNVILVVLNVPLISVFVLLLRVPISILSPLIIVFCVIGAYSLDNSSADVLMMVGLGLAGYLMRKVDLDPAPLVLAFVLGQIFETALQQSLLVGRGSLGVFLDRPIAAFLIGCSVCLIVFQAGGAILARARAAAGRGSRNESQPMRRFSRPPP
ncbi:MAG: tripartite tricarboxylate transporter permease [candidate division NC10 bacterium]|nr:tripartite tricarboxylate transporter permease [candidate division NC10 bacterium]